MQVRAFLVFGLFLLGCKDDEAGTSAATLPSTTTTTNATTAAVTTTGATSDGCAGPGLLGCPCVEGKCLEGLKCLQSIDTCIDPSDLTGGDTGSADSVGSGGVVTTGGGTTGDNCPAGFENCPCLANDTCIIGLDCVMGTCWYLGDGPGEMCVDDYQACTSQVECCDFDQHCLDFTNTNGDGVVCTPECATHTECPSKCCGGVTGLDISVCYSAPCDSLCVNTCIYHDDGECDDGGDGSLFAYCEYGTDCADCGNRSSANAPW